MTRLYGAPSRVPASSPIGDDRHARRACTTCLPVMHGRGSVKSCMFSGFKQEWMCVERTVDRVQRLIGLDMRNPRAHRGIGSFRVPATAVPGGRPIAGERAGFQDAFVGFGMRYAILSGVMSARALLGGEPYVRRRRHNASFDHLGCTGVWCRCGGDADNAVPASRVVRPASVEACVSDAVRYGSAARATPTAVEPESGKAHTSPFVEASTTNIGTSK